MERDDACSLLALHYEGILLPANASRTLPPPPGVCVDHALVLQYEDVMDLYAFDARVMDKYNVSEEGAELASGIVAGVTRGVISLDGVLQPLTEAWDFYVPLEPKSVFGELDWRSGHYEGGLELEPYEVIPAGILPVDRPIRCMHVRVLPARRATE